MVWKPGSVILEAKPFALVVCQKYRNTRCNFCLASVEKLKKCASCTRIYYCSVQCQKQDWHIHKVECKVLRLTPEVPTDSMLLFLRILIRFVAGDAEKKHPKDESPCIRKFNDLMHHSDKVQADPTRSEQFQVMCTFLLAYARGILQLPGDNILLDIFGRMVINTFTVADEMLQDVGVAVYSSPSILDHRCWPNAVASFDGRKVMIRAVDHIEDDSLSNVYLSYVDPLATRAERNQQLQQQYYFTCTCSRCLNQNVDDMMSSSEGSHPGDVSLVKDCLDTIDTLKAQQASPKDILARCQECLQKVTLPYCNVFLVRLVGKAFDAAIDAEEWETALSLGIRNYKPYSILHHPYNPCVGYLLANMGKLLMLFGRLPEASIHLRKALENLTVSLGESHHLHKQVQEMMLQCQAELENQPS